MSHAITVKGVCPIDTIAELLHLNHDDYVKYGDDKAKLSLDILQRLQTGKIILMSAISPTPAGEGKTTMNIGLSMGLNALGYRAISALREPSLGPVFGMKGGATGGGKSTIEPSVDINLHFTGDLHAITSCHNLLSAIVDNHIYQGNQQNIDPDRIVWNRVMDVNDRALRKVFVANHSSSFDITAASEIMAIVCLASDLSDLRARLGLIQIGYRYDGTLVLAKDMDVVGAMMVLLKDAIKPNLVQTCEGTPVIVHGGPFANIAHGCNSVIATKMAMALSDYVVTEAGFGADLGAEKFFDIKSYQSGLNASAAVVVATIRALKYHGGVLEKDLADENVDALNVGFANLKQHVENMRKFQVPVVVAINVFPSDTALEITTLQTLCNLMGVQAYVSDVFAKGSKGALDLAKAVVALCDKGCVSQPLYTPQSVKTSLATIAWEIYRAKGVVYSEKAAQQLETFKHTEVELYPVCIAKTQYSFSDNPKRLNVATDFDLHVREFRVSGGAKFVVAICGPIMTMPGLPKKPNALRIDLDEHGMVSL